MKKETIKLIGFMLVLSLFIFLSHYYKLNEIVSIGSLKEFIKISGWLGPIFFLFLYIATSVILFPAALLSIAAGSIWGVMTGTILTVISAAISSIIPFFISRGLGNSFMDNLFKKNETLNVCDNFLSKNGVISVLTMRLIPLFSWDLVNYGSGLCNIKFRDYLLATALGTIPGSLTYNLIGSQLGRPLDLKQLSIIIVLSLSLFIGTLILRKKQN